MRNSTVVGFRKKCKPNNIGGKEVWTEDNVVNTLNCFEFDSDIRTPEIICHMNTEENSALFCDLYNFTITGNVSCSINANSGLSANHAGPTLLILNDMGGDVMNVSSDVTATLRAQDHGHPPVICFEPGIAKREGSRSRFVRDTCVTLRAEMGDNQPAVVYEVNDD